MSVWASIDRLAEFVYRSGDHLAVMRRRRQWFERIKVFPAPGADAATELDDELLGCPA